MAAKKKTAKKSGKASRPAQKKAAKKAAKLPKKSSKKLVAKLVAKSVKKKAPQKRVTEKKRVSKPVKKKAAKKRIPKKSGREDSLAALPKRPSARSGGQSGDAQGLSDWEGADSESVEELIEEGNAFEADVVAGVESADNADEQEVHTHEVPEDDVPGEYLDEK
jgi:hypothetical protein